MDVGLAKYVRKMLEECSCEYGMDISKSQDKNLCIVYVYNKMMSYIPDTAHFRALLLDAMTEVFGLKNRALRYNLDDRTVKYRRAEYITRTWETKIFDVGTFHTVRNIEWYEKQKKLLRETNMLTYRNKWKKGRYVERLAYCSKPVMISSVDGSKIKIAQDFGVNEWNVLELMGEDIVNERQGTSDTDGMC